MDSCFGNSRSGYGGVTDPFEFFSAQQIANAAKCPVQNVITAWPLIHAAMEEVNQASKASQAGMIGTIAIETGPYTNSIFTPREELYNDPPGKYTYFENMYGIGHHSSAAAMGNTKVGDGAKYYGRGFIQITWKNNYLVYGNAIGVDLVNHPELALDINNAAKIAALFWKGRDIQSMCNAGNWVAVRAAVQGGSAGLDHLYQVVHDLGF